MSSNSDSRRRFLRGSAAGLGALALGGRESSAAAAPLRFAPAAFGAQTGGALIWIGDEGARRLRVDFGTDATLARAMHGPVVLPGRRSGHTSAVRLAGLTPGEPYHYRVVDALSGKPLSGTGRLKTAPVAPRAFSFAFSACMQESYAPFRLFDVIGACDPDFFLHLGDTVYADQPQGDFEPSLAHYRRKHAIIRRDEHLQRFLAKHLTYAIWDDHEIGDGAHGGYDGIERAMQAFREYWPADAAGPDGLYRRFAWAGTDFFILDTRRFRSPQNAPDGRGKTMLGAAQKAWFLDGLKASTAPFKFVVTAVPFHGGGADDWGGYRTERNEIVNAIRGRGITGVVFLSADYHMARDWTSTETGLREYMAGPIAQYTLYERRPVARELYRSTGAFHFGDGYNFGLFRVDAAAESAVLEFVGADGNVLYRTQFFPKLPGSTRR